MKKSLLAILLIGVFMFSACQTEKTDVEVDEEPAIVEVDEEAAVVEDYTKAYDKILEEAYNLIKTAAKTGQLVDGKQGISENASYLGSEALDKIGYAFEDVNNDGVEELLIGMESEFSSSKNSVLEVYTIKNSKPHFVLEGRSRNSYSLLENGNFYNYGSNGAMYTIFGEYKLNANGELDVVDYYFSYEKESYDDIGFFHNKTGIYEKAQAEELNISDEEFWDINGQYEQNTKRIMFKPFATLKALQGEDTEESTTTDIIGVWECSMRALDMNLALRIELSADGTASYDVGEQGSEWISENEGTWSSNEEGIITFDLKDNLGESLYGEYKWSLSDGQLLLQHISGNPFIYGEDGKTFTFNKN